MIQCPMRYAQDCSPSPGTLKCDNFDESTKTKEHMVANYHHNLMQFCMLTTSLIELKSPSFIVLCHYNSPCIMIIVVDDYCFPYYVIICDFILHLFCLQANCLSVWYYIDVHKAIYLPSRRNMVLFTLFQIEKTLVTNQQCAESASMM